ncbi:hypothetical protein TNCV_4706741 [Trichonephila clavipes]|nr:hypothetical protein TNCV_4706741 [Trichonephila clavipes]
MYVVQFSERFFALLPVLGKKAVLEWRMKEGLKLDNRMHVRNVEASSVIEENNYMSRSVRKGSWIEISDLWIRVDKAGSTYGLNGLQPRAPIPHRK